MSKLKKDINVDKIKLGGISVESQTGHLCQKNQTVALM